MYRFIADFLEDWKYESESTLKIFNAITEEKKNQSITSDGRTLSYLAWHITNSLPEIMNKTGHNLGDFDEQASEPERLSEIISFYKQYSEILSEQIVKNWKDDKLTEEIDMYGEIWSRGKILSVLIVHQIHHRAQMTVLMRQAGLLVPGIYGPSKEEWTLMGKEAQK